MQQDEDKIIVMDSNSENKEEGGGIYPYDYEKTWNQLFLQIMFTIN